MPRSRQPGAARPGGLGPGRVSNQLARWLKSDADKTLSSLVEVFQEKSFAILFVLLLGVPALPLPTGGATHVFELIALLLAVQLIAGRREIWVPARWRDLSLAGERRERFVTALMRLIRRLERLSRPRLRLAFQHRISSVIFGVLVIAGTVGAFVAPPFSGLDTLPAGGVVLLSLGVLLEDILVVLVGVIVGAIGITLEVALGRAAFHAILGLV